MASAELIQVFVSLLGASFNVWSLWDAYQTTRWLERNDAGLAVVFVTIMRIRRELIRLGVQVVLIILGVVALSVGGSVSSPDFLIATKVGMVMISILSATQSVMERMDTRTLVRLDEELSDLPTPSQENL